MSMTPAATLVVAVLASVAASSAAVLLFAPRAADTPAPTVRDPEVIARLDGLAARLEAIEKRPSPVQASSPRNEAGVTREEIQKMVEAAVHGTAAGKPADTAPDTAPPLDLQSTLAELTAPQSRERFEALWAAVRKSGRVKELLDLFKAQAEAAPQSTAAQCAYGQACIQALVATEDFVERASLAQLADKAFDKTLALDPSHWEARYTKAVSYTFWPDFLGKKGAAIENFQILVDQQESMPVTDSQAQTYLYLGNLLEAKDPAKAQEMWQRGLRRHPNSEELRKRLGQ